MTFQAGISSELTMFISPLRVNRTIPLYLKTKTKREGQVLYFVAHRLKGSSVNIQERTGLI